MKVLVVGGGGREHALCWGLARSPRVTELVAAPGNAGIDELARTVADVSVDDVEGLVELTRLERPDLVVVGPEAPLVAGLADALISRGSTVFGPSAAAARLEGSKAHAKELMVEGAIPTARAGVFTELATAIGFVDALGGRAVIKADGLAAGKGVTVAADRAVAVDALEHCLDARAFGEAGATVVVEELLEGPEISAFALVDATSVVPLALSQDFKRVGEGDSGPNTGGMGAYSPLPWVGRQAEDRIWTIVRATVDVLRARGVPYRGLLYTGLMLTAEGPKVLEYNCRFGDPETEVVIPRLASDLADLLVATATDRLSDVKVSLHSESAVTVVLASGGYPGPYASRVPIEGLDDAVASGDVSIFHAGTARDGDTVVTSGGRVLAVTGMGATIEAARAEAYRAADRITFEGKTCRRDIAAHAARLAGEEQR
ncbi:MAG: phosphoribosylamine--glycine ligase [Actinomycetota bacterium]|nr:phosphoribosylamine--glycine ligase [Actinomycetota bacterium]